MKKFEFRMINSHGTVIEYIVFGDIEEFEKAYKEACKIGPVVKGASVDKIVITEIELK